MALREEIVTEILKQKEIEEKALRSEALKYLYLFNRYVLKIEEGANHVPLAPFHKELCDFTQSGRDKKKLILVPRLHLKSTLITVGYSLFRIVADPNIRILILSGTFQNAADFVGAIKDHLSRNETLINLFGNLAKNPLEWSNNRITLRTPRTSLGDKEPTVLGAGIETNVVSKHFDLVILDDVVVRENVETLEQIDKVIKRYRDAISLLEPKSQLLLVGTRWTDIDLYSWILDPQNNQKGMFDLFLRKALNWDGDLETALTNGQGFISSLWEAKFPRDELLKRFKAMGPYEFSTQFLNDAVPPSEALFKPQWFHAYEEEDIRHDFINNYLLIDPALSKDKHADYTAMVLLGVDRWGNFYVRDVVRERFLPHETVKEIFKLNEMWRPKEILLEEVSWQKTLAYAVRDEMRLRGRSLPIFPVKPAGRSKEERIRGLQPLYAAGKVFHYANLKNLRFLEDELKRFPHGQYDDIIDAMAYALDRIRKPRPKREERGRYLY